MSSRTAQRPADEDRFLEFKARRLAKKEADRMKLASEFPLLFNNKANSKSATPFSPNAKTPFSPTGKSMLSPAGKRKSVIENDENNAYSANKSASKMSMGGKTPMSNKKSRKGSMIGSRASVQPIVKTAETPKAMAVASVPEAPVAKVHTVVVEAPVAISTIVEIPIISTEADAPRIEAPVDTARIEDVNAEASAELAPVSVEDILEMEVPSEADITTSESAPTAQIELAAAEPVAEEEAITKVDTVTEIPVQFALEPSAVARKALFEDDELEHFTSTRSSLSSLGDSIVGDSDRESGVQEQVLDVLDYLLELDEVDEVTYRRMSSQAFSVKSLKRLSMSMKTPTASANAAAADSDGTAESVVEEVNSADSTVDNRRSSDVPMDLAYPEQNETFGELDVLNALRNYLTMATRETVIIKETAAAPVVEVEVEVAQPTAESPLEEFATSDEVCTSTRSSGISETTFDPRPQWSDTSGRSSLSTRSSTGHSSHSSNSRSSLDSCCTTTMRVSFTNSGAISTSQKRKSSEIAQAQASASTAAAAPEVVAHVAKKSVVTHPLADLLDDALMRGLVVPTITERIEMGNHTKYIVQTQILAVPGYPEENSRVKMMALKRYSDFKTLRIALTAAMEAKRRVEARSSLIPGKLESGSDDILSLARSRRSSVDSCYRESLLNPRDSLGADTVLLSQCGFGGSSRVSELLPPLPSRQLMSMSCASLQQEEDFQSTREAFLRAWIETAFAQQSCESPEYRMELRKFLSA